MQGQSLSWIAYRNANFMAQNLTYYDVKNMNKKGFTHNSVL